MTSIAADFARRGLAMAASITGQSLAYRAGTTGPWIALPSSASLIEDMPMPVMYEEESHRGVVSKATAKLYVVFGSTHLRPGSILNGYQVRKTVAGTVSQWAVVSAVHNDGVSIYDCTRALIESVGAVPGGI